MFNKDEFYRAFGDYRGVPSDVTITNIEESATYSCGCETCGGDMEYEVEASGTHANGERYFQYFDGKIGDFLRSL